MPLSTLAVKSAKPGPAPYKLADFEGLYLLVKPNGAKLWRYDYRFGGKRKTAAFGAFPGVPLAQAREHRDEAKKLLRAGADPALVKRTARLRVNGDAGNSFEEVARAWHDSKIPGWSDTYAGVLMRRMERRLFADIGKVPIEDVDAPLLLGVMRKIEPAGAELARQMLQVSGQVFRFAIAEGRAKRDPSRDLRGALKAPPPVKHRAALKAAELPEFLSRLEAYDGAETTQLGLRLVLLTMVRTGEARFARWAEFENLDGPDPLWRIPAERMKMRRDHLVPLSDQAAAVATRLRELAYKSPLVFPAPTRTGTISENTLLFAMYRMGLHSKATVHGMRGTASTILNESGLWGKDWIEMQLAHVEGSDVRAAYNAAEYLADRRRMLQWWADYLDRCAVVGALVG